MTRWLLGFSDPNQLGAVAGVVFCLLVGLAMAAGRPQRPWAWLWSLGVALSVVALVGSLSRGAWIAVAVALAACVAWPRPLARRWLAPALGLLLVALICVWPRGMERTRSLAQGGADPGNVTRMALWRAGCAVVADHPWSGVPELGVRGAIAALEPAPEHLRLRRQWPLDNVCNDILQRGTAGGLVLALPWLAGLFGAIALGCAAAWRGCALGLGLAGAATVWLVAGQFSCVWAGEPRAWWLIPGLLALVAGIVVAQVRFTVRQLAGVAGAALFLAAAAGLTAWGVACLVARTGAVPQLLRMGDQEWAMAPRRGPVQGSLVWFPAADGTPAEARSDVLAVAARRGWVASIGRVAGPEPVIAIAQGEGAVRALALPAAARVLLDCPPEIARTAGLTQVPLLLVYGQPDDRGWSHIVRATSPDLTVLDVPLGRLWSTRFARLWPYFGPWLPHHTTPEIACAGSSPSSR